MLKASCLCVKSKEILLVGLLQALLSLSSILLLPCLLSSIHVAKAEALLLASIILNLDLSLSIACLCADLSIFTLPLSWLDFVLAASKNLLYNLAARLILSLGQQQNFL